MTVSFLSAGAKAASSGVPSVPWPNGAYNTGDLGVMLVETANEVMTLPSGWSEFVNSPQGGGTSGVDATATRLTMYWKRATSNAEANVALADAGDHGIGQILVFTGVHSLDTVLVNATAGDNTGTTTSTSVTCPAVSTTTDNCFILATCAEGVDAGTARFNAWAATGTLSGFTVLVNTADATANGGGFSAAGGLLAAAGNSDTVVMGLLTTSIQARITVALTPAPPSTGSQPIVPYAVAPYLSSASWVVPYPVTAFGAS